MADQLEEASPEPVKDRSKSDDQSDPEQSEKALSE